MAIPYIEADRFPSPRRLGWQFDAVLIGGICLALIFGVAAIGAVQPWAEFALRSFSVGLFLIWAVAQLIRGRLSIVSSPVYAPALAFAGLVVAQLISGVSAYRHDTLVELLNYTSYGLLAFVMLQSLRGSHAGKALVFGISGFGLAVSVFALLQYLASNGKLYWTVQVPADAPFFGTYVNHNHYAGLMEMLIAFPLVFALQGRVKMAVRWFLGFSAIVMAVSVVESGSRGGTIALICQIVVLMVIGRFTKMKRGAVVSLLVMLVAMAVLLAVVADSAVVARISTLQEPSAANVTGWRMHLNHDSFAMLRARPILGWGLGAFPTVYPQFRSFYDDAPIREAHNDYMQLLTETGVAGGLITAWFLVVLLREGWRNLERSQSMWDKGITTAAIVSVSGILVHSASDFNLHIPANAAIFFVMCAVVASPMAGQGAQTHGEYQRNRSGRTSTDLSYVEPLEGVAELPRLRVVVRRR